MFLWLATGLVGPHILMIVPQVLMVGHRFSGATSFDGWPHVWMVGPPVWRVGPWFGWLGTGLDGGAMGLNGWPQV